MSTTLHENEKELRQYVIENFVDPQFRTACETCHRGAIQLPIPTTEDLEALYHILRGFDQYRRNFTPETAARIDRCKYVLGFLNSLHAGTSP